MGKGKVLKRIHRIESLLVGVISTTITNLPARITVLSTAKVPKVVPPMD
jgi:hypothetical protein